MNWGFKRSVLTILLLIPLTLLMPGIGFGGEPPETLVFAPPLYIGTLTAEWQPTGTSTCSSFFDTSSTSPCGNVIIYGKLECAGKRCKDIIITKKKAITIKTNIPQVDFLNVDPTQLQFNFGLTFPLGGLDTYFAVLNTNDLSYQTGTLCTLDVVVMQLKPQSQ